MSGGIWCVAALLLVLALPARAYDPALRWYTLRTPNFVVHYHDGLAHFAQRAARDLELAHALLVPAMGHAPRRKVQVVISDDTDSANGSATAYLRPTIRLFAAPPDDRSELNDYDDYVFSLVVHEHTHILHLDQVYGAPEVFNAIFGRMLNPNAFQPDWIVEGYAIHHESRFTSGGRARSSLYDMYLRGEILDGVPFGIDDASNAPVRWPRGSIGYLHGAQLIPFAVERYGESMMVGISRDYGGRIIPYGINLSAEQVTGETWLTIYAEWRKALAERVSELVEEVSRHGLIEGERRTFLGERHDSPRFAPGGEHLYYVEQSADRRAAIRAMRPDGTGNRLVHEINGRASLAFLPDGSGIVFSQPEVHRQYYVYEDLFRLDLASGHLEQLTQGARLTAPDVSPDGSRIVAVRLGWGGASTLVTLPIGGGELRTLYAPSERSVLFTPRFSPDGRFVAFSEHRGANRDIRLLDLVTGELIDVTSDRALDLNPTFDPTGRYIVFASDRTGIYNLYAYDRQRKRTTQLTNTLTGAFRPEISPDGRTLAYITYGSAGYDVAVMPFNPAAARPAPRVDLERPAPRERTDRQLHPVEPYSPLETLAPQYWLPLLENDPYGPTVGLTTGGADVVGRHSWSLAAAWGIGSNEPSFDASYSAHVVYPRLGLNLSSRLAPLPMAASAVERQTALTAFASFPFSRIYRSLNLAISYDLRHHAPRPVPLPTGPAEARPFIPERGLSASVGSTLSFSNAQRFANGISPARGFSVSAGLRFGLPELGGDFSFASVDASATTYLTMPWLKHHVLALRGSAALGSGDLGGRRLFSLGGLGFRDPVLDALTLTSGRSAALRGYPRGAFLANSYVLANAEYRFPLAVINQGLFSLPAYLRRFHGALGFDLGQADAELDLVGFKPSVSAELRTELMLGYNFVTDLRLGYARGLASEGIHELYVSLGQGF